MLKPYIQKQIKACSSPEQAAEKISFNMVHQNRTASPEELQRRRDDLALIIKAANPSRAADKIIDYMKERQLGFLGFSNPEPLQKFCSSPEGRKATARLARVLKSCGTSVVFKAKAS